ncbi:MAG TPA: arsinothricin resistance N-acetyltransferase ArsN1 family B [Gammaproteobacteria bacterium]|nr:arsinothricin resistance N-acetyltransferase ArsN1 family B [Gammaproteobacteria bacterium]
MDTIRHAVAADAAEIAAIYNYYVETTVVTFEEKPVSDAEIAGRIEEVQRRFRWLVHESDGRIDGYAYASLWRPRSAYRYSVETTVYVRHGCTGRGVGTALYRRLIDELRALPVHTVIGGIALPNDASVALHEKLGFEKIGRFREVGWKLGRWVDVGYWELILDRGRPPPA